MKYLYTGVRVRDLERSIQFYRGVMGMRVSRRGKMSHGGVWVELQSPGSPQRLELNWYPPENRFFSEYRNGEELDHLAFLVTDVEHTFQELVARGAHPEVQPFREERYEFAFVSDPDGIWIELVGRIRLSRAAGGSSDPARSVRARPVPRSRPGRVTSSVDGSSPPGDFQVRMSITPKGDAAFRDYLGAMGGYLQAEPEAEAQAASERGDPSMDFQPPA